jgi:hypothetical protein
MAFNNYIWHKGNAFMQLVDWLNNDERIVNVTPHVINRYARILAERGILPATNEPSHVTGT